MRRFESPNILRMFGICVQDAHGEFVGRNVAVPNLCLMMRPSPSHITTHHQDLHPIHIVVTAGGVTGWGHGVG